MTRTGLIVSLAAIMGVLTFPVVAYADDPLSGLTAGAVRHVNIGLNPWGGNLGFSVQIAGDDPAVRELVEVIRVRSEPASDHRCSNRGFIRFRMADGSTLALGLLPGHAEGFYELRVYRDDEYVALHRIDRAAFLTALGKLGVPLDDPAFAE